MAQEAAAKTTAAETAGRCRDPRQELALTTCRSTGQRAFWGSWDTPSCQIQLGGAESQAQVGSRLPCILEARGVVRGPSVHPVLVLYRTYLSPSLNSLEERLCHSPFTDGGLRQGSGQPLDLSPPGHRASVGLPQQPSVVTSGAPCPRPQLGMQRKEAWGHSEVGAGRQGPDWLSLGGGRSALWGQGPGPPRRESGPGQGRSPRQMGASCCLWLTQSPYLSLLDVFWALPLFLLVPKKWLRS